MQIKINPNGPTGIAITPDGGARELRNWGGVREGNDERRTWLIEIFPGASPGGGDRAVFTKIGNAWRRPRSAKAERE